MLDRLSKTFNTPKNYRSAAASLGLVLSMVTGGAAQDVVMSSKNDLINETDSKQLVTQLKEKLKDSSLDISISTSQTMADDKPPTLSNDKEMLVKMGLLPNGKYRFQVWEQGSNGYPVVNQELSETYRDATKKYRMEDRDSAYASTEITKGVADFVDQLLKQTPHDKQEDTIKEDEQKKNRGIWPIIALGISSISVLLAYLRRKKKTKLSNEEEVSEYTVREIVDEKHEVVDEEIPQIIPIVQGDESGGKSETDEPKDKQEIKEQTKKNMRQKEKTTYARQKLRSFDDEYGSITIDFSDLSADPADIMSLNNDIYEELQLLITNGTLKKKQIQHLESLLESVKVNIGKTEYAFVLNKYLNKVLGGFKS